MIALRDHLPLIRFRDGSTSPLDRHWLLRSLRAAARKAGYPQWWLAEHVTESIINYLSTQSEVNVLPMDQLSKAVQSVLQVIGYSEISRYFVVGRPVVQISLVELAREAGTGYELAFFEMLARRIQEIVRHENAHFELFGLEACVKMLRSRKVWSRDCDTLRAEIVSFTRTQTGLAASRREVSFSLA